MHIWIGGVIGRVYDRIVQDQFENHSQMTQILQHETEVPRLAPACPENAHLQRHALRRGHQRVAVTRSVFLN